MSENDNYEGANVPNPHADWLITLYPQRPLYLPKPGYPIDRALSESQILADTFGLTRYVAWVDSEGVPHLVTVEPRPEKVRLFRGGR